MSRIPFFTRPSWKRLQDGYFEVTGEAVSLDDGSVIAQSLPIRVPVEIIEDAETASGPGADRLIEGVEQAVQGMARERASAKA